MLRRRGINGDLYVHQGVLEDAVNAIFSSPNLIKEARKQVSIKHPLTGQYLEVDVWYPDLKLCFEYQDDHHYQPTWYQQKPLNIILEHDDIKRSLLLQRGETLIEVPCWWDGSSSSLRATIHFYRPELFPFQDQSGLIPTNPSSNFFLEEVPLMLASFPYSVDLVDVSESNPWWLGEKYDGVRCFWNPQERQLYSRHGITIDLYPPLNCLFCDITLDGEIWCGRGLYLETNFTIQSSWEKPNWSLFRVVCFDEASQAMMTQPFEKRYSAVLSFYCAVHPFIVIAPRFLCDSNEALTSSLLQVVEEGGEGVIIRRPCSPYQPGRSSDLVKLKGSKGDREAVVVNVGHDSSLELQLPDGSTFVVPKEDCILHRRARVGDVVSFTHNLATHADSAHAEPRDANAHTQGAPTNPIVYRIREDLSLKDSSRYLTSHSYAIDLNPKKEYYTRKPNQDWNYDQGKSVRARLETLATEKGIDFLVAENWYKIPHQEFSQDQVVRRFLNSNHMKHSWAKAVKNLFPELNLDISKFASSFSTLPKERAVYEKFAREKGGNPLDPRFWYSLEVAELTKEMKTGMFYKKGYKETVTHIFPELHLVKSEFKPQKVKMWQNGDNVRVFFDDFAASQGFDSLVPSNWYNVALENNTILNGGKLSDFLMWIYPDIGLQYSKFNDYKVVEMLKKFAREKGGDPLDPHFWYNLNSKEFKDVKGLRRFSRYERYMKLIAYFFPELDLKKGKFLHAVSRWSDKENRKKAMIRFATAHSFDPLTASNWYHVSLDALNAFDETRSMLAAHYNSKYIVALMDLFPELNLDPTKFTRVPLGYWQKSVNRRAVFLDIAKKGNFDPLVLSNWYNISSRSFKRDQVAGYKILKQYYNGNILKALKDLFPEIKVKQEKREISLSSFSTKLKS
eukprot:Phypoly_transcript_02445.p1 GENE.Phypoly_transcript_02445~~Phypoly_transcript_02445.p1  ORF type:complete len:904 (+),score=143.32 Phypoly_transcript_02445:44-2755(+)